jgi:hypothetical protein
VSSFRSDHFFGGVAGFFVVLVVAGFAVDFVSLPVDAVVGVVDDVSAVDGVVEPVDEPLPVEPEPVDGDEPEPVEPLPIESVDEPLLGMPEPDVPVLDGVALEPMPDVSAGVAEFVVALSGDFAGSLSPPQATAPATRAALRTIKSFMRDSDFGRTTGIDRDHFGLRRPHVSELGAQA